MQVANAGTKRDIWDISSDWPCRDVALCV